MTPRQRFLAARLAYVAIVLIATLTELFLMACNRYIPISLMS